MDTRFRPDRTALLLTLLGLLTIGILLLRHIDDVDIFWQIQLGQLMLDGGGLVTRDHFTYTHAGDPVPTVGWLAQILFALVYRLGGWSLVQLAGALVFSSALVVAACGALILRSRQAVGLWALAGSMGLALLVVYWNSYVRPQTFAFFCFAVLMLVVRSKMSVLRSAAVLFPTFLFWQNAHPSVLIGAFALVPLCLVNWIKYFQGKGKRDAVKVTIILFLAGLCQLATPMGWDLFELSAANVVVSRDWLQISEWMPPWNARVLPAMLGFWAVLLASVLLLVKMRLRVSFADGAVFVWMTLLSLCAARFTVFWALALIPVWARWLEQTAPRPILKWQGRTAVRPGTFCCLTSLALIAVVVIPALLRDRLMPRLVPSDGIAQLSRALPRGRIFNFHGWGGPLILAGYPAWKVAMDGRLYLYDLEEWRFYRRALRGEVPLDELLERYRPDAFFLAPLYHEGLIDKLRQAPRWRRVHSDSCSVVFVRG